MGIRFLTPAELVRQYWTDQPYGNNWLPGERPTPARVGEKVRSGGRFPPSLKFAHRCSYVGADALRSIYNSLDREPAAEQILELQTLYALARNMVEKNLMKHKEKGVQEFARWFLGQKYIGLAIWPLNYDWNLPFTVGGSIVWPEALLLGRADESRAKTLVHEMVHVAQFQSLASGTCCPVLSAFAQWTRDLAQSRNYFYIGIKDRICDWVTDYVRYNFHAHGRTNGSLPEWWLKSMQNPDTFGHWYGAMVNDTPYLPWMVFDADSKTMQTWLLPLGRKGNLGQWYILAAPAPILKNNNGALRSIFGCSQYDHPHEVAAHLIADLCS